MDNEALATRVRSVATAIDRAAHDREHSVGITDGSSVEGRPRVRTLVASALGVALISAGAGAAIWRSHYTSRVASVPPTTTRRAAQAPRSICGDRIENASVVGVRASLTAGPGASYTVELHNTQARSIDIARTGDHLYALSSEGALLSKTTELKNLHVWALEPNGSVTITAADTTQTGDIAATTMCTTNGQHLAPGTYAFAYLFDADGQLVASDPTTLEVTASGNTAPVNQ